MHAAGLQGAPARRHWRAAAAAAASAAQACRQRASGRRQARGLHHNHHQQLAAEPGGRVGRPGVARASAAAAGAGGAASDSGGEGGPRRQGAPFSAAVFTLANVIMGAGYVSMAHACRQGGWAALIVLWLLGGMFCYTGHALLQCCRRVNEDNARAHKQAAAASAAAGEQRRPPPPPPAGYEAVAGRVFGPRLGLAAVSAVMYAELLGICCVYVVLEAETLAALLGHTALGAALGPRGFGLLATALMLPTVMLPDLEALSVLGMVGVVAAAAVGLVLAALFVAGGLSLGPGTAPLHLGTLPSALGMLAFVYAGHSTFPVIQQSMADPAAAPRAVTWGYALTAVICSTIGFFGYALFGSGAAAVVTANLPTGAAVALACTALTAANPFSAFAPTLEPVALAVQRGLWRGGGGVPYPQRAAVRLGLALACCATALAMPFVADLMAFVGALLTMSVSLICPALMHALLFGRELPWWALALDAAALLLGVGCAAVGATSAAASLQQKLALAAAG